MAGVSPLSDDVAVLLSSYLDGELTPDELADVVAVLESDLTAVAEFRRLKEARSAVRTLPTLNVPLMLLPGGHLGEELSAYLDGELPTTEMPNVMTHLAECADCRDELASLDRSRTAVRALPGVEPPEFLGVHRAAAPSKRSVLWPAAVAGGIAALALLFTISATRGTHPTSIDVADLQSRHTAVASVPSSPTGFEVSNP